MGRHISVLEVRRLDEMGPRNCEQGIQLVNQGENRAKSSKLYVVLNPIQHIQCFIAPVHFPFTITQRVSCVIFHGILAVRRHCSLAVL